MYLNRETNVDDASGGKIHPKEIAFRLGKSYARLLHRRTDKPPTIPSKMNFHHQNPDLRTTLFTESY